MEMYKKQQKTKVLHSMYQRGRCSSVCARVLDSIPRTVKKVRESKDAEEPRRVLPPNETELPRKS